jgi:hypothetical protein
MNAYVSMALRDLTCGAAAALITLILSVTFVQSTSVPPGIHAAAARSTGHLFIALQPKDAWFGQPEPAVLVD